MMIKSFAWAIQHSASWLRHFLTYFSEMVVKMSKLEHEETKAIIKMGK